MKKKHLFIASAVFLLLAFIVGALLYKSGKSDAAAQATSATNRPRSRTLGHARQPARRSICVEFFDPACETCKEFSPSSEADGRPPRQDPPLRPLRPVHKGSDQVV